MHLAFPENGQVCVRLGPLLPTRGGGFGPHAAGPFGLKVLSLLHMSLAIPGSVCTASRKLACSGGSVQPSCSDSITLAELQDPQRRAAQGRAGAVPGEEAARLGVEGTLNTNQNWVVGGGVHPADDHLPARRNARLKSGGGQSSWCAVQTWLRYCCFIQGALVWTRARLPGMCSLRRLTCASPLLLR